MARTERQKQFCRDYVSSIPGAAIRAAVMGPLALYEDIARRHWAVVKENEVLRNGLYNSHIVPGERIAANWGQIAFFYSIAVLVPSIFIAAPINVIFCIVDIIITVYLWQATIHQQSYTKLDLKWCSDPADWPLPTGANETFFVAAARLNATATTPYTMCKTFVMERRYGISISVLYTLISTLGLLIAIYTFTVNYKLHRAQQKSLLSMLRPILNWPRFFIILLTAYFYYIPVILFRCLPFAIKSRVRYARRYVVKSGQAVEEKLETKIRMYALKKERRKEEGKQTKTSAPQHDSNTASSNPQTCPPPLAKFLAIYDMLVLVSQQDLHYMDIVHLSRTCKALRATCVPVAHQLRRYTCTSDPSTRQQCWLCLNHVCNNCTSPRRLPQTRLYFHLDICRPYCTPCYTSLVLTNPHSHSRSRSRSRSNHPPSSSSTSAASTATRLSAPTCPCAPPTTTPSLFQKYMRSTAYYTRSERQLPNITRHICSDCTIYTDAEILAKREERTKRELKEPDQWQREGILNKYHWGRCARDGCRREFGGTKDGVGNGGPRWWVCSRCWKECTCGVHAAWSEGTWRKTVKDEHEKKAERKEGGREKGTKKKKREVLGGDDIV